MASSWTKEKALGGEAVQDGVLPGLLHVFAGDLEKFDVPRPEAAGVQSPGAGVGKGVQDLAAGGDVLQQEVIVALVEEKSGFLALEEIDPEVQAVDLDHLFRRRARGAPRG